MKNSKGRFLKNAREKLQLVYQGFDEKWKGWLSVVAGLNKHWCKYSGLMDMKKLHFSFSLLGVLCLFFSVNAYAQEIPALAEFNQTRLDYNQNGMLILGTWAVGNMVWGGIGARHTTGETKAFHQMNLYWNSVNLLIAGFGYWQATKGNPGTDFWATMEAQQGIEKILLLNGALDLAYMAGGLYMRERGLRTDNSRLIGFGKSVILQGAFLLAFDSVLYGFHRAHGKELPSLVQNISLGPTGVNFKMDF